jgi:hypothetical protein
MVLSLVGLSSLRVRYEKAATMAFSVGLGRIAFDVFTGSGW